ncbi:MAG: hypothetical protein BAJALOKI3v1_430004 [Promethearchaeota archaeon]|nr:MAG: hypothetical protein BAJALOKI3v1_430004 [Candidatus Lokiarchaeota archaeon]
MHILEIKKLNSITVKNTITISKIRYAFNKLLYVPEPELKFKIIEELVSYLKDKLNDDSYPLKVFIAKNGRIITGIVVCQIDPDYRSYGRKCGTFGWLYTLDFESCKSLMEHCKRFMTSRGIRKFRGPINYPKIIGGVGFQIDGFDQDMMTGVTYHDPEALEPNFLRRLSFVRESEYWCVKVTKDYWKKGSAIPSELVVKFPSLRQLRELKGEILQLAYNSFNAVMADATGGEERMDEMIRIYEIFTNLKKEVFLTQSSYDPSKFTDIQAFRRIVSHFDFAKRLPWVTLIFNKDNRQLVGVGLLLPNIYQVWAQKPLTQGNGDTVMIHPDFIGKGVFSLGQNIGQVPLKMYGITHIEGTQLWANNKHAVEVMFPHTEIVRKHIVFHKKIR